MLRHILKSLWTRRHRNGWIFAELILVYVVTWIVIDPLYVIWHNTSLPDGFDKENLYQMKIASLPADAREFKEEENDFEHMSANLDRICSKLRNYERVEATTIVLNNLYPYSSSTVSNLIKLDTLQDAKEVYPSELHFLLNTDFIKVFRFRSSVDGTWESLAKVPFSENTVMVSENVKRLFGTDEDLVGKEVFSSRASQSERLVAVYQNVKNSGREQPIPTILIPVPKLEESYFEAGDLLCFFRVSDDISKQLFLEKFLPWASKELRMGNLYVQKVVPFSSVYKQENEGTMNNVRQKTAFVLFFIINIFLGVAGTFWLNTRTRREEIGIRLSFGSTPASIIKMLLLEGIILTTIASVIGCFIYLQWALKEGLGMGEVAPDPAYLINHFAPHFILVSLVVYFLLLIVVSLGIWLPARAASKINPVDALRDE